MFAIKEAVRKGISAPKYLKWHDIEIMHQTNGKPTIQLTGTAETDLQLTSSMINISTSDEYPYAIAFAILSIENT